MIKKIKKTFIMTMIAKILSISQILSILAFFFVGNVLFFPSFLKATPTDPTILVTPNPNVAGAVTQNLFPNGFLSVKVCAGTDIKLDVISVGTSTLTYQWIDVLSGVVIGTTNPFTAQLPDGQYQVKVIDNTGQTLSSAVLEICVDSSTPINASITANPNVTQICATGTGSIVLTANASNPSTSFICPIPQFSYKWFKDNVLIAGQTNKTLTIANQTSGVGTYTVQISNACGFSGISSPTIAFTLVNTLPQNPQITNIGGIGNLCTGGNVTLQASALGVIGSYEWFRVGNPAILGTNASLSTNILGDYYVKIKNVCGVAQSPNYTLSGAVPITNVGIFADNDFPCQGDNVMFSSNITPALTNIQKYEWFKDGILVQTFTSPFASGTNYTVTTSGTYSLKVTNVCGTTFSADYPLNFNQIPANAHVEAVGSPSLGINCTPNVTSVELKGVANGFDFFYIWYQDGVEIVGENNESYFATTVGNYQVKMINACGEQLSPNFAVIEVSTPPITNIVLSSQGNIINTCVGNIVLQTALIGAGTNYKWYKDNNLIATTNTPQYNATLSGMYKLKAENGCGSSNFSNELNLNINVFPDIPVIASISNLLICQAGGTATLQMTSAPNNGVIYVWQRNGTPITAPFSNTITLSQAGIYTIKATNSCGSRTSNSLEVRVLSTPQVGSVSILNPPCQNPISLQAQTIYTDVQFQWIFVNGSTNIVVANTQNYQPTQTGTYSVGIRNDCLPMGVWITSAPVNIDLNNATSLPIPTINSLPLAGIDRICPDGNVILQAQTTSTNPNIAYRWFRNGVLVPNATNNQITANVAGNYSVETYISNAPTCTKVSAPYGIIIRKKPVILLGFAGKLDFCEGDSVRVRANSQVTPSLYRWFRNGVPISQSQSIGIKNAGTYKVEAVYNVGTLGFPCEYVATAEVITTTSVAPLPNLKRVGDMLILLDAGEYFQWNLNGVPIINANAYQYLPLEAGNYTVIAKNELGCFGVSETIYHEGVASFQEGITISPNPNQGEFRVTAKGEGEIAIQIMDAKGVLLTSEQYMTRYNSLAGNNVVAVSNISSGIYLVRAKIGQKFYTKKVIVNK